jgi:hypothetical protein
MLSAGGSVHDICVCVGMSVASFYRVVRCGIDAINACPSLAIKFPITVEELMKSASEFEFSWTDVDGWLSWI